MTTDPLRTEIDRNFDSFQRSLGDHLREHAGEHALLRHGEVVDFFRWPGDADRAGFAAFPDGLYSIQRVTREPVDLGFYVNAVR